jgi:hypothetical protein
MAYPSRHPWKGTLNSTARATLNGSDVMKNAAKIVLVTASVFAVLGLGYAVWGYVNGHRMIDIEIGGRKLPGKGYEWVASDPKEPDLITPAALLKLYQAGTDDLGQQTVTEVAEAAYHLPCASSASAELGQVIDGKAPGSLRGVYFTVSPTTVEWLDFLDGHMMLVGNAHTATSHSTDEYVYLAIGFSVASIQATEKFKECMESAAAQLGDGPNLSYMDDVLVGGAVLLALGVTRSQANAGEGPVRLSVSTSAAKVRYVQWGAADEAPISVEQLLAPLRKTPADPPSSIHHVKQHIKKYSLVAVHRTSLTRAK